MDFNTYWIIGFGVILITFLIYQSYKDTKQTDASDLKKREENQKKWEAEQEAIEIKHLKLKEQVDVLVNEFEKKMESVSKWYEIVKYRADFLLDIPEEDEQETRSNYYKEECLTKYNEGDSNKNFYFLNPNVMHKNLMGYTILAVAKKNK